MLDEFCVGNVTVLMTNSLVLTGRLSKRSVKVDNEPFLTITLTSPLLVEPGNKGDAVVLPFYMVGDRVELNEEKIISIGPANLTNFG